MAVAAELMEPETSAERRERAWRLQAQHRITAVMDMAGLTQQEHDAFWLRVGYLQSWRQIAVALGLMDGAASPEERERACAAARRVCITARAKLRALIILQGMWWSPLHPDYRPWRRHPGTAFSRRPPEVIPWVPPSRLRLRTVGATPVKPR